LLTFSSGAYLNEQGITNRLATSETVPAGTGQGGRALCDDVSDSTPCNNNPNVVCGEDPDNDIDAFAQFMRASKVPSRDTRLAATSDAQTGQSLFNSIGCNICHITSLTTAPAEHSLTAGHSLCRQLLATRSFTHTVISYFMMWVLVMGLLKSISQIAVLWTNQ